MDTGAGVALAVQEVFQSICSFLGFHKDQSQRVFTCRSADTQVEMQDRREQHKEHVGREKRGKEGGKKNH